MALCRLTEMTEYEREFPKTIFALLGITAVAALCIHLTASYDNTEASDWRPARAVDEGGERASAAGIAPAGMGVPAAAAAAAGSSVAAGGTHQPPSAAALGGQSAIDGATVYTGQLEDAASLEGQAEIAACLAGEARRTVDAWALDMRSARGHAPPAYVEGLERMIAAGTDSAYAMDAWAHAAGQAAADGEVTEDEAVVLWAVERNMADARAAAHDAIASIPTWQRIMADDWQVPSIATGGRLANTLTGEGTECY